MISLLAHQYCFGPNGTLGQNCLLDKVSELYPVANYLILEQEDMKGAVTAIPGARLARIPTTNYRLGTSLIPFDDVSVL